MQNHGSVGSAQKRMFSAAAAPPTTASLAPAAVPRGGLGGSASLGAASSALPQQPAPPPQQQRGLSFGNLYSARTGTCRLWHAPDLLAAPAASSAAADDAATTNAAAARTAVAADAQSEFVVHDLLGTAVSDVVAAHSDWRELAGKAFCPAAFEKQILAALARDAAHRRTKTRRVVECIEKWGFAVVTDPVLEHGLPVPLSLSTAQEPTGMPMSGLVADLAAAAATDRVAGKVVDRRNGVEFLLKYLFGVLQNSHYGLTPVWGSYKSDIAADAIDHLDTAYLNCGIDLHTDATYLINAPKLQGFGLIHSDPHKSIGGANVIVDGYAVADYMFQHHRDAFWALASQTVPAYYAKDGMALAGFRPVLQMPRPGHVAQVSFNAYDRAPSVVCQFGDNSRVTERTNRLVRFYEAYSLFGDLAHGRRGPCTFHVEIQPRIGQMLIFDNHRALHARTAFSGPRIMCGSYVGADDYVSSLNRFHLM